MATDVQAPDAALVERERVVRALREHEADLRALGVTRLWLFGSLARGDPGRRSDVDVLISVPPAQKFSLLDLAGVRVELCDAARPRHRCRDSRRRAATVLGDDQGRSRRGVLMPRAPVADRLRHMLDAIARIETLTAGKTFEDYAADWVTRDAVERNLERVSEASRHVPSKLKAQHRSAPLAGDRDSRQRPAPRLSAGEGPARLVDRDRRPRSAQSRCRGDTEGDRRDRARGLSWFGAARSLNAEVLGRSGSFGLRGGLGSFARGNARVRSCVALARVTITIPQGRVRARSPVPRARSAPGEAQTRDFLRPWVRSDCGAAWICRAHVVIVLLRVWGSFGRSEARVRSDAMLCGFRRPNPIGPGGAHDTAPALIMAPCSPGCSREGRPCRRWRPAV